MEKITKLDREKREELYRFFKFLIVDSLKLYRCYSCIYFKILNFKLYCSKKLLGSQAFDIEKIKSEFQKGIKPYEWEALCMALRKQRKCKDYKSN
jgi:hypothetical protein